MIISSEKELKYEKPKILFVDIDEKIVNDIRTIGFNIQHGSFGKPYLRDVSDDYFPVMIKPDLPNYSEQEVIFIDLTQPEPTTKPEGEKYTSMGEVDIWCKCNAGIIDPRPRAMREIKDDFDRILHHGGLFVIFAQPRFFQDLVIAQKPHRELRIEKRNINLNNWSFLSIMNLEDFDINHDSGREISIPDEDKEIYKWLRTHIKNSHFSCTIVPSYRVEDQWYPILYNKYGLPIGGLIVDEKTKGRILILPQIKLNSKTISSLIKNVLPELSPHLFPYFDKYSWTEREEYELLSVLKIKSEKEELHGIFTNNIKQLDDRIIDERKNYGFLHDIISKTGSELVDSLKIYLDSIGFEKVLDIDDELERESENSNKQEDLQIQDDSPTLLLEIKGISGLPRESAILQVVKYVPRRMKNWNRTDVRGVSIINHQRNIPGLDRDNPNVFTDQQIEDAKSNDITLMTTWA